MAGVSASSTGVERERGGAGAQQLATDPAQWFGRTEQPLYPLHRVGGGRGEPRRGTGGAGEHDQRGGQHLAVARACRRVVGVHLDQPRYLRVRIPRQRNERKHLGPILAMASSRWWWWPGALARAPARHRADRDPALCSAPVVRITVGCGPATQ